VYEQDERLTIRVPGGMKRELERLAIREQRSTAAQIRHLLGEFIGQEYDRQLAEIERTAQRS
jgi:predicted transcriptional regulator